MDPGVLGFRELTYDLTEEDYKSPRFASALVTERDEILKDLLTVEVQEAQFEEENKSEE